MSRQIGPAPVASFSIRDGVVRLPHMIAAKETTLKQVGEMLTHVVEHMATKADLKHFATKDDLARLDLTKIR